ncbi:autotransporter outer membrane beta-barrel domain-containing protein, partial [Klebsiella pneumoniae]
GTDLFVNTGIVSVLAGASRAATVALLGLDRFENRGGLIDLRNGHVGDQLVLPGDYVGSAGARLGLDVRLSGDGAADTLVVKGAATGKTSIVLTNT